MAEIVVIGSGFAGLSAATALADAGHIVTVLEKNETPGGRARSFSAEGFTFDMGPSWYWMPDVFEDYFRQHGYQPSDFYELKRLDPSYRVVFSPNFLLDIPASMPHLEALFEQIEAGAGNALREFLAQAKYKYEVGMHNLVHQPGRSLGEYMDVQLLKDVLRLDVFKSLSQHVRKFFKHPKLLKLVEFPVLFLGATPQDTPALYSLMNYADMSLGTWYPMGGMHKIVEAMVAVARKKGVKFIFNAEVTQLDVSQRQVKNIKTRQGSYAAQVVVAGADYHHVEQKLLVKEQRSYTEGYWKGRTMAPSSLLFYLGIDRKIPNLLHHNLFFDRDFELHAREIYKKPSWPADPLFYACVPSITDDSVAPEGMENLFLLIPVAPGLEDTEEIREKYFQQLMDRLQVQTGVDIRKHIVYKRSYAHRNFMEDYHAFKGNAYGLANTLMQTAYLKPKLKSKKVDNLYFTGQLTVPGPGVPPSLISGNVVAKEIIKDLAS